MTARLDHPRSPRHRPPVHFRRTGFTLIETLAALLIFSVAVVALIENFGVTSAIEADITVQQRAQMLAQNVLEEVLLDRQLKTGETKGKLKGEDAGYSWTLNVTETQTTDLLEAKVTISWEAGRGEKEYSLATLLLRPNGTETTGVSGVGP